VLVLLIFEIHLFNFLSLYDELESAVEGCE